MEWGQQMQRHQTNMIDSTYQSSRYTNERNRKRTLILDIDDSNSGDTHLGAGTEFNIQLFEPLNIDKHSEIYLDNFLSFNSNISQTLATGAFVLKINEFNMNSNIASSSNNNNIFNSLIIPNEHKLVENNHSMIINKAKKFNYVCDINPQTIRSISGTITDLSGSPIFHGNDTTGVFTYALTGIDAANYTVTSGFPILSGTSFNLTETGSTITVPSDTTGNFLATHLSTSTTLHFSTNNELTDFNRANTGTIIFSNGITLNHTSSLNLDLILIQNPGRFIAEFSIISRE